MAFDYPDEIFVSGQMHGKDNEVFFSVYDDKTLEIQIDNEEDKIFLGEDKACDLIRFLVSKFPNSITETDTKKHEV